MKQFYFKFFFLLLCVSVASNVQAIIKTNIDRTHISKNDTFQVVYTLSDAGTNLKPDLTPLKKDFRVVGISESTYVSIVNGISSRLTRWVISLSPKKVGRLAIPAIKIGQYQTEPSSITVTKAEAMPSQHQTHSGFLTLSVSNMHPVVQSEVIYTLKLYYTAAMRGGSLSDPEAEDALVMTFGESKHFIEQHKGKMYKVLERKYAVFPQKSGRVNITGPVFSAVEPMLQPNGQHMYLARGKQIQLIGRDITLDVKPRPSNVTGEDWFPATAVRLKEDWSDLQNLKEGQPFTRIIQIEVDGATAEQIPKIKLGAPSGLKHYREKANNRNVLSHHQHHILGIRTFKVMYVPSQTGMLTIPNIKLNWWDTQKHVMRTASLPAKQIMVGQAETGKEETNTQFVPPVMTPADTVPVATDVPSTVSNGHLYRNVILSVIAGLCFLSLLWWFIKLHCKPVVPVGERITSLKSAFASGDLRDIEAACLQWGEVSNLGALIKRFDGSALADELRYLERALYAGDTKQFDAKRLLKALQDQKKQAKKKTRKQKEKDDLPPLNP